MAIERSEMASLADKKMVLFKNTILLLQWIPKCSNTCNYLCGGVLSVATVSKVSKCSNTELWSTSYIFEHTI